MLDIYPLKLKAYVRIKPCMQMIIAALFIITKIIQNYQNLEVTKMSFSRWVDKLVHPDNRILFSAKKKWKLWKDMKKLKFILLSERRWSEKNYFLCDSNYMTL